MREALCLPRPHATRSPTGAVPEPGPEESAATLPVCRVARAQGQAPRSVTPSDPRPAGRPRRVQARPRARRGKINYARAASVTKRAGASSASGLRSPGPSRAGGLAAQPGPSRRPRGKSTHPRQPLTNRTRSQCSPAEKTKSSHACNYCVLLLYPLAENVNRAGGTRSLQVPAPPMKGGQPGPARRDPAGDSGANPPADQRAKGGGGRGAALAEMKERPLGARPPVWGGVGPQPARPAPRGDRGHHHAAGRGNEYSPGRIPQSNHSPLLGEGGGGRHAKSWRYRIMRGPALGPAPQGRAAGTSEVTAAAPTNSSGRKYAAHNQVFL